MGQVEFIERIALIFDLEGILRAAIREYTIVNDEKVNRWSELVQ